MQTQSRFRHLCSAALGTAIATAPLATTTASAADLVWARYGDIASLDPHQTTSTLSMQVWHQIYDTLLGRDAAGTPVPNMAKAWTVSDDGKTVSFQLHEGIKCHDGSDFTSADVKYTWEKAFDEKVPSNTKSAWGPISAVETPDATSVVFKLTEPFAAFIPFMADPFASMLCASNKQAGEEFGTSVAIGTGPWVFESWDKGDRITLNANKNFVNYGRLEDNKGAPKMDKLIIRVIREGQARLAALKTGEVHIAEPPIEAVPEIKESKELKLVIADNTGQNVFLEFAISRPPFDDKRARQAVAYGINTDVVLKLAFNGLVEREYCTVARGVEGNDQDFCKSVGFEYDPAKAKALLKEMGYGPDKPLEVKLMTWTGGNREKVLQVIQNQLKQVGINAKLETMDIGSLNARVKQENNITEGPGSFDLMGWSWYDPDILYQLWHSPGAYEGFNTPELDALLDKTRTETDPETRLEVVQAVQKYLIENAVHVPLYTPGWMWLYAMRSEVDGFVMGPFNQPTFTDVTVGSAK